MINNDHIRLFSLLTEERTKILHEILFERLNQESLKAGVFKFSCADKEMGDICKFLVLFEEMGNICKFLVLFEEVGDVSRAILNDKGVAVDVFQRDLREELVKVAAVCVAWVECLDKKYKTPRK